MRIAFLPTTNVFEGAASLSREQLIYNSLKELGHELISIQPPHLDTALRHRIVGRFWRAVGLRHRPERSPFLLRKMALLIEQQLYPLKFDLVFSLGLHTTYLQTKVPMVNWGDAVFACIVDFYESHTKMDPISIYQGHYAEQRSLRRCDLSIMTSNWAACIAARRYRFPLDRLCVVQRGANLPDVPSWDLMVSCRNDDKKSIGAILIGSEWDRKGGAVAWETICRLRNQGYLVNLVTIGMVPPVQLKGVPGLQCFPFLNKGSSLEYEQFKRALVDSDVLLLPTRADFTPNVIPEAYAFGLPVIASGVGAIPEMIDHGVTGFVVQDPVNPNEFAACIERFILQPELLVKMRMAARRRYDNEMNLQSAARKLSSLFEYVLYRRRTIGRSLH